MRLRIHAEIDNLVEYWRQEAGTTAEETDDSWAPDDSRRFTSLASRVRADNLRYCADELENLNHRVERGE